MRRLAALAACCVTFAALAPESLSSIATRLVGRPVQIKCLTAKQTRRDKWIRQGDVAGYVLWTINGPSDVAVIAWPYCIHVRTDGGELLLVLHEIAHLRGIIIENDAECWALWHVTPTAKLLGADAPKLLREALITYESESPPYKEPGCKVPRTR